MQWDICHVQVAMMLELEGWLPPGVFVVRHLAHLLVAMMLELEGWLPLRYALREDR